MPNQSKAIPNENYTFEPKTEAGFLMAFGYHPERYRRISSATAHELRREFISLSF
jgi:hypothetical protein